jgi:hypothetical protein
VVFLALLESPSKTVEVVTVKRKKAQCYLSGKSNGEITNIRAMKTYWGSGGIVPLMLNFAYGWGWVVKPEAPTALTPRKNTGTL